MKNIVISVLLSSILFTTGCKSRNESSTIIKSSLQKEQKRPTVTSTVSIHDAAMNGDFSQVSMQLESGVKADTADKDGRTPLLYASYNGQTEIIKVLLKNGASINYADINGRTALMMASSGPYPEAVKLLLDNNADPNLIDKEEHFSALMYAASEGQMENVKILLARKANPMLKDIDGDDAESFARQNNHNEVAELIKSFKTKY